MPDVDAGRAQDEAALTYRVRACNIASDSDNKIHDDTVARRYGFAGGLVPGIVVFGYLTRPLIEHLGVSCLESGNINARFLQPCYDGEEVLARATRQSAPSPQEAGFDLMLERPDGTICARGTATIPASSPQPPNPADYPTAPLPEEPPTASASTLAAGNQLGTVTVELDEPLIAGFAESIHDDLPLYRGPASIGHPALMLQLANDFLGRNVRLGPWIHAASDVQHYSLARCGDTVSVRGQVSQCFERKGHEFVVLDLLVLALPDRPLQHVQHTAIYKPRQVA